MRLLMAIGNVFTLTYLEVIEINSNIMSHNDVNILVVEYKFTANLVMPV